MLVIDCGNSRIKLALLEDERITNLQTVNNPSPNDMSAIRTALAELLQSRGKLACAMSSVAAPLTSPMIDLLKTEFGIEPMLITSQANHGLRIHYSPPESLGADRIADSAAAVHLFGTPCITVNFGTATTLNVLVSTPDNKPSFIGGVICAGVEMTTSALTARLPNLGPINLVAPVSVIAQNTKDALSSGVLFGHAAMVDGLVTKIRAEQNIPDCPVVATGGYASLIALHCKSVTNVVPELTLLGIAKIAERSTISD